jgi:hypothetical protein
MMTMACGKLLDVALEALPNKMLMRGMGATKYSLTMPRNLSLSHSVPPPEKIPGETWLSNPQRVEGE